MVYVKPVMRVLSGVALAVACALHHQSAYGQSAAGSGVNHPFWLSLLPAAMRSASMYRQS